MKRDAVGLALAFERDPGVVFQYPWVDYGRQIPREA